MAQANKREWAIGIFIIIILFTMLGYIAMGKMIIVLLLIVGIFKIIKKLFFKQQQSVIIYSESSDDNQHNKSATSKIKGKKRTLAKWYSNGQDVNIQSYKISAGLIYVGEQLKNDFGYENDASLIDPNLEVSHGKPWQHAEKMGYWPRYGNVPPSCRGAYLEWLAGGRSEPKTDIGYVFLFFYGLERRLFVDGQQGKVSESEWLIIVDEVRRLLKLYGKNSSFLGYANNFLATAWLLNKRDKAVFSEYIDLDAIGSTVPFQILLAQYVADGKPIPADMALTWFKLHPEFNLRTPARRCTNEFKRLFQNHYTRKYGDGLLIKPNKTKLKPQYHAASPSMRLDLEDKFPELPNPFILTGPLKKINAIVENCTVQLDAYSRFLGRKREPNSLAAFALLPAVLMEQVPIVKKFKTQLERITVNGLEMITVEDIFKKFGEELPLKINKKENQILSNLIEGLGFGMAPDIRYHNMKPSPKDQIVVFPKGHGIDFSPSKEFRIIGTILRLGAMVSQIDNDCCPAEENTLKTLIFDNRELNGIEKDSLAAFLHWCLITPQNATGLKKSLAEISEVEKKAISHILISVAHADGHIDPGEIKQLEKLYTALGLDKQRVIKDIHSLSVEDEPVTVSLREQEKNHAIPKPNQALIHTKGFSLDQELIKIRDEETTQIKGVLENIFTVQDEQAEPIEETTLSEQRNPLSRLDEPHQIFFNRLKQKESWKQSDVENICKEIGLMFDGALEVVNEWAYDNVNAPLIDSGEPLYVDIAVAKEILDA